MAAQDTAGIELGTYRTAQRGGDEGDSPEEAPGSLGDSVPWTPPPCTPSSSSATPVAELPRKRKGEAESFPGQSLDYDMEEDLSRSEESEDQQVKMKCFRKPHRHIEKRRRDKMNGLIEELSAMLPACAPAAARKADKLTVLRSAVLHLKTLQAGTLRTFSDSTYKPAFLPEDDLQHIVLRAADGFLLVVSCDRGKVLFISESVSKILNISRLELMGQSLFHFVHPKDITKVKEQLSASEFPHKRLVDAATGEEVQDHPPTQGVCLSTGARRSFFCRMKHCRRSGTLEEKSLLPGPSKKKDSYSTVHCTGYMRSWPCAQLDQEEAEPEKDPSPTLTCLVTVCRVHPTPGPPPPRQVQVKPAEFVTRCATDGKFTFVDQQATLITGYLPQEVLGTSCYEYFHQDDLQHLAEKHRQVLRSKEKVETNCYRFKTKQGPYVCLQSQWFSFTNPWTKEVDFIVSSNRVIPELDPKKDEDDSGSSKALQDDSKRPLPIIPGLSTGVGKMIYAGSIGTQIANELVDSYRTSSSPSSGAASPFGGGPDRPPAVPPPSTGTMSSGTETPGTSADLPEEQKTALVSINKTSEETESGPLDLDQLVVPGLSSFSSDEAAMAVIMSLMESDTGIGQEVDYGDIHWPV